MPVVREVAVELCDSKRIEILQKGKPVDQHNFKGPIRLRQFLNLGIKSEEDVNCPQKALA
jgi:hypothetical protein